ncbi:potassium channel family protein [Vibrio mexicanus]|uniref:potassium channel family protein n=1 Tax=Vibrio mexicanus TaxID=1004326 RepID=UPI00063CD998|nr:potassium channel family protein [Vibrio mexicanus]
MKTVTGEDNFYFLFVALLLLFFGCAAMQQFYPEGQQTILGLLIVTLSLSIAGIRRQKKIYRSWYGLLLVTAAVSGVISLIEDFDFTIVTLASLLAFFVSRIYSALKQVVLSKTISGNHIVGSICIYLLMGLSWATLYLLILEIFPQAFNGLEPLPWLNNLFNALYFSFITLTTVGYGDISPTLPIAQFFVFLESIIGSFYLAIMVASLVSMRLAQSERA